jgi:hypothetical protein
MKDILKTLYKMNIQSSYFIIIFTKIIYPISIITNIFLFSEGKYSLYIKNISEILNEIIKNLSDLTMPPQSNNI